MISAWWLLPVFILGAVVGCMLEALAVAASRRDAMCSADRTQDHLIGLKPDPYGERCLDQPGGHDFK